MGRTGPDGQNIPGQKELLINEKALCNVCYTLQNKVTYFYKKAKKLGYLPT